jgi:hypothetical protein
LDSSDYKKGLQSAKSTFKDFVANTKKEGEKAGGDIGQSFSRTFERKLGLRDAFRGLFTGLGMDIPELAKNIASMFTGGNSEEWKRVGEIADREAEAFNRLRASTLSASAVLADHKKDFADAMGAKDSKDAKGMGGKIQDAAGGAAGGMSSWNPLKAQFEMIAHFAGLFRNVAGETAAGDERNLKALEAKAELLKDEAEKRKKLIELSEKDDAIHEESLRPIAALEYALKRVYTLNSELLKINVKSVKYDEKKAQLQVALDRAFGLSSKVTQEKLAVSKLQVEQAEKERQFQIEIATGERKTMLIKQDMAALQDRINKAVDGSIEKQELLNQQADKTLTYEKQLVALREQRKELVEGSKESIEEQSKMTLGQVANNWTRGTGFQRDAARKAQEDEARAKDQTARGDVSGAAASITEAQGIRHDLAGQGMLKKSEDPMGQAAKKLDDIDKHILDTNNILGGKFVPQ